MNRKMLVLRFMLMLALALLCAGWTWDDGLPLAASWVS